jgi:lipoprotein-releasing system ATP-binding protein
MSDGAVLALAGIERHFEQGGRVIDVLKGVDLAIMPGEVVALLGPSGAGKSTLLHIAGLLEAPDAGTVTIGGVAAAGLADGARTRIRREKLGFVYQFHHLLAEFTAIENVVLPQLVAGLHRREAEKRARNLLERLGLADRLDHYPGILSGGEQQRVAIARALANNPVLLLADEPTGNLDEVTAGHVFDGLRQTAQQEGVAALIATHNPALAERMDRRVTLHEGRLTVL